MNVSAVRSRKGALSVGFAPTFRPYAAVFDPLPMEGNTEVIAGRLGDAILLGQIVTPSIMSPVADLAERFGVGNGIVEQALQALDRGLLRLDAEQQFHLRVAATSQSSRLARMEIELQREIGRVVAVPRPNADRTSAATAEPIQRPGSGWLTVPCENLPWAFVARLRG